MSVSKKIADIHEVALPAAGSSAAGRAPWPRAALLIFGLSLGAWAIVVMLISLIFR